MPTTVIYLDELATFAWAYNLLSLLHEGIEEQSWPTMDNFGF